MISIDFTKPLLDADGNPFALPENQTAGKVLSAALLSSSVGPVVKFYDWGMTLHKGKTLTVDNADREMLVRFVETHPTLPIITKKQMLDLLKSGVETE